MGLKIAGAIAFVIISFSCAAVKTSQSAEYVTRATPVQVGEVAPDFTLEDQNGQKITLSAARGLPTVLVFYRGHW